VGEQLWIADDAGLNGTPIEIARSGRIGISAAQRRLLRFYVAGNPYVSGRSGKIRVGGGARKLAT
jgi:3-methyladenine DNA glycosylase Mpg